MATTESTRRDPGPAEFPDTLAKAQWVAVLGRRDHPTDGVEDYCIFLGQALERHAIALGRIRVPWADRGWVAALRCLWAATANRTGCWALLQYTTMGWSRRAFPFGAWIVFTLLRLRGLRCAVVFHEAWRQMGDRLIDRIRGSCQEWVIGRLYSAASVAIFLDPLDKIRWLPKNAPKAVFIPIGANVSDPEPHATESRETTGDAKTVAVFCLSEEPHRQRELADVAHAMRIVAGQGIKARVVFLGRGTDQAREEISRLLDSTTVPTLNLGLQSAHEVSRILSESDAMLCVRGPLYMRRGSAIAGIACGLPIIGYGGEAEGTPLEEAGVELVPYLDSDALGQALARVLTDDKLHTELQRKSIGAQERHFSWGLIANKMAGALQRGKETPA